MTIQGRDPRHYRLSYPGGLVVEATGLFRFLERRPAMLIDDERGAVLDSSVVVVDTANGLTVYNGGDPLPPLSEEFELVEGLELEEPEYDADGSLNRIDRCSAGAVFVPKVLLNRQRDPDR